MHLVQRTRVDLQLPKDWTELSNSVRTWSPRPDDAEGVLQSSHPFETEAPHMWTNLLERAQKLVARVESAEQIEFEEGRCVWGRYCVARIRGALQPMKRLWVLVSDDGAESAVFTWIGDDAHISTAHEAVLSARPLPRIADSLVASIFAKAKLNFEKDGALYPVLLLVRGSDITSIEMLTLEPQSFGAFMDETRAKVALTCPDAVALLGESAIGNEQSPSDVLMLYFETPTTRRRFIVPITKRKSAGWRFWESNALGEIVEIDPHVPGAMLVGFFN